VSLRSLIDQLALHSSTTLEDSLEAISKPKPALSLQELDHIFQAYCSIRGSYPLFATHVFKYIAERACTKGWGATKKVWATEEALHRTYKRIEGDEKLDG
jgi:hypothetical protein